MALSNPFRKVNRRFGWRKEPFDSRDKLYRISAATLGELPQRVDMRETGMDKIPVEDQLTSNSCVGHAATTAMEYLCDKERTRHVQLSRLWVYFGARYLINETNQDEGCYIRDAVRVLAKQGVCIESMWPFGMSRIFRQPTNDCWPNAAKNRALEFQKISSLVGVKDALAKGIPVIFGMSVFESFQSSEVAKTGRVPFPRLSGWLREREVGRHAMTAIGYDDTMPFKRPGGVGHGCILARNSWGKWGEQGDCWIPYPFFQSAAMTSDMWVITKTQVIP